MLHSDAPSHEQEDARRWRRNDDENTGSTYHCPHKRQSTAPVGTGEECFFSVHEITRAHVSIFGSYIDNTCTCEHISVLCVSAMCGLWYTQLSLPLSIS